MRNDSVLDDRDIDLRTYQQEALKSIAIKDKSLAALAHRTLGLSGEAGTLANTVKKVIRDKNGAADEMDLKEIKKRIGDTLYYVAVLAEYFNLHLDEVAEQNLRQSSESNRNRQAS